MVRIKSMELIWSINGVVRKMRTMRQRKRCWVPEFIYFLRKWENICQSGKK